LPQPVNENRTTRSTRCGEENRQKGTQAEFLPKPILSTRDPRVPMCDRFEDVKGISFVSRVFNLVCDRLAEAEPALR
jgi:hypothetical protein